VYSILIGSSPSVAWFSDNPRRSLLAQPVLQLLKIARFAFVHAVSLAASNEMLQPAGNLATIAAKIPAISHIEDQYIAAAVFAPFLRPAMVPFVSASNTLWLAVGANLVQRIVALWEFREI